MKRTIIAIIVMDIRADPQDHKRMKHLLKAMELSQDVEEVTVYEAPDKEIQRVQGVNVKSRKFSSQGQIDLGACINNREVRFVGDFVQTYVVGCRCGHKTTDREQFWYVGFRFLRQPQVPKVRCFALATISADRLADVSLA